MPALSVHLHRSRLAVSRSRRGGRGRPLIASLPWQLPDFCPYLSACCAISSPHHALRGPICTESSFPGPGGSSPAPRTPPGVCRRLTAALPSAPPQGPLSPQPPPLSPLPPRRFAAPSANGSAAWWPSPAPSNRRRACWPAARRSRTLAGLGAEAQRGAGASGGGGGGLVGGGCRSAGPPAPSLPPPAARSLSLFRLVLG